MSTLSPADAFCGEGKKISSWGIPIGDQRQVREPLKTECGDDHSFYFADGEAYTLGVNLNYEKLTGLGQEYVYGRNIRELEDLYFKPSVTLKVLKTRLPLTIIQHHYTRNKKLLVTGNPVFNQEGEIILVVTLVKAIKAQKGERICLLPARNYTLVGDMVITSPQMQEIVEKVVQIAGVKSSVVVTGESGTGKELIARSIHDFSPQKEGPFVAINVAAMTDNLLEAELFGYVGGAFTGANPRGSMGLIKKASGGVLFLDEISELPLSLQAKLLRFLDNKEIIPVGGNRVERVDVRIVCATNSSLKQMVAEGRMRRDLYYRLNVFNILVPPLRERKEDIPALCSFFLDDLNKRFNTKKHLTGSALEALEKYAWPGNVRELKNILERFVVLYPSIEIGVTDVENELSGAWEGSFCIKGKIQPTKPLIKLSEALNMFEKEYISNHIARYSSVEECARAMGIHRTTLIRKMKRYGL